MMDIFLDLFYCLSLTIAFELCFAIILGVRGKKNIINIILVQILTNPLLVSIQLYLRTFYGSNVEHGAIPIMELIVVLIEGYIYFKVLDYKKINPFLLSLMLNAFSFGLGLGLNYFITGSIF